MNIKTVPEMKRQNRLCDAREDTLPLFSKTKEEEKGGRVSPLEWYQPVLTFRSVIWRLGPGTVLLFGSICNFGEKTGDCFTGNGSTVQTCTLVQPLLSIGTVHASLLAPRSEIGQMAI